MPSFISFKGMSDSAASVLQRAHSPAGKGSASDSSQAPNGSKVRSSLSSVASQTAKGISDSAASVLQRSHSPAGNIDSSTSSPPPTNSRVRSSLSSVASQAAKAVEAVGESLQLPSRSELQVQIEKALASDDGGKRCQLSNLLDAALATQAFDVPGVRQVAHAQARSQLNDAIESGDRKRLMGALVAAKRLQATSLPEFELATQKYKDTSKLPLGWDVASMVKERQQGRLMARATMDDPSTLALFQRLVDGTYRGKWTRDRQEDKVPSGYDVVRVLEVQNDDLWVDYAVRKEEIRLEMQALPPRSIERLTVAAVAAVPALPGPDLDVDINEVFLFHGTSPIAVDKITADSFSLNFAGSCTGTLYGRGLYFAEHVTKADEYAKGDEDGLHTMIVCRVTMGHQIDTAEVEPDPRFLEEVCMSGAQHSVVGDRMKCRGTFREFVVFNEAQVYANFVIQYRRRAGVDTRRKG